MFFFKDRKQKKLNKAFRKAASKGNVDEARDLFMSGADVNSQNWRGLTPLHFAAAKGHAHMIKFLLKEGADKDIFSYSHEEQRGNSPAEWARMYGHHDIGDFLDGYNAALDFKQEIVEQNAK